MPKFGLILSSSWSNDKYKGQIYMKIYKSDIRRKLIEKKIQWNQIRLDWT